MLNAFCLISTYNLWLFRNWVLKYLEFLYPYLTSCSVGKKYQQNFVVVLFFSNTKRTKLIIDTVKNAFLSIVNFLDFNKTHFVTVIFHAYSSTLQTWYLIWICGNRHVPRFLLYSKSFNALNVLSCTPALSFRLRNLSLIFTNDKVFWLHFDIFISLSLIFSVICLGVIFFFSTILLMWIIYPDLYPLPLFILHFMFSLHIFSSLFCWTACFWDSLCLIM